MTELRNDIDTLKALIKELLEKYGLRPVKDRGQNFLLDDAVVEAMAEEAGVTIGDKILEIGPGLGMLTDVLLERGAAVAAVELDPGLANIMRDRHQDENLEIIEGDFLKFNLAEILSKLGTTEEGDYKAVANLPYAITSNAIRKLLTEQPRPKSMTIMIQREVAQRAVAEPPKSGLLSIVVQTYGEPKIIKKVPRSSFWPQPKVESAVLHISLYSSEKITTNLNGLEPERFLSVVKQAFSEPRKQIKNTLSKKWPKDELEQAIAAAQIPSQERPERVSFQQWVKLTEKLLQ